MFNATLNMSVPIFVSYNVEIPSDTEERIRGVFTHNALYKSTFYYYYYTAKYSSIK